MSTLEARVTVCEHRREGAQRFEVTPAAGRARRRGQALAMRFDKLGPEVAIERIIPSGMIGAVYRERRIDVARGCGPPVDRLFGGANEGEQ